MAALFLKLIAFLLLINLADSADDPFQFNGFGNSPSRIDSSHGLSNTGLLQLTDTTFPKEIGRAFYSTPFRFKSPSGKVSSFSTTFVFAIVSKSPTLSGHGIAFVISPTNDLYGLGATAIPYMGLFNVSNYGNSTNHVVAVELDTLQDPEFQDINDNHVGIDINSLTSNISRAAAYYNDDDGGKLTGLTLTSGKPMQVWVDYDGTTMQFNVTLSPFANFNGFQKPTKPLLSAIIDLSDVLVDEMYVGFSSSTGSVPSNYYILGWSFALNQEAHPLDSWLLPQLPQAKNKAFVKWILLASGAFVLLTVAAVAYCVKRRINKKYAEVIEEWEHEYGPRRFFYKDLYKAANGFKDEQLLGSGGFGKVYHGVLPGSNLNVAIKKISHESKQGMKEFVAEIASMGQLRHRNLVQLLGYCRREGELLLVYDFMPNGSLDRFLFGKAKTTLSWSQRFHIIKGVASGLLYLHEDGEKVVIHRDIKASNVMLDEEMNGRLGDFGLARLYDHGADAQTTRVAGTMGYIAPEISRTGRASVGADVFAFGVFLLEVVCGRRPIERRPYGEDVVVLVDWVLENWRQGKLFDTRDLRLGNECSMEEVELVLKLGLLCSNLVPSCRPTMRQVLQILDGTMAMPELSSYNTDSSTSDAQSFDGSHGYITSFPSVATYSYSSIGSR